MELIQYLKAESLLKVRIPIIKIFFQTSTGSILQRFELCKYYFISYLILTYNYFVLESIYSFSNNFQDISVIAPWMMQRTLTDDNQELFDTMFVCIHSFCLFLSLTLKCYINIVQHPQIAKVSVLILTALYQIQKGIVTFKAVKRWCRK